MYGVAADVECVCDVLDDACVLLEGVLDGLGVVIEVEDLLVSFLSFGCVSVL